MAERFMKQLRSWRGKRTQQEAADKLGVNVYTYRNWEYGRSEPQSYFMTAVTKVIKQNKRTK